jgi:hypothetical protein
MTSVGIDELLVEWKRKRTPPDDRLFSAANEWLFPEMLLIGTNLGGEGRSTTSPLPTTNTLPTTST